MQAATLAANVVIVNCLLVLCSIPLVTAGAAQSAAHGALLEEVREQGGTPIRTFFRHWRLAWLTATLGWLIVLALSLLFAWEYWALGRMVGMGSLVGQAAVISGAVIVSVWAVWFFPLASDGAPFRQAAVQAGRKALTRLPRSLVAVVAIASPALLLLVNPQAWAIWLAAMAIFGWAFVLYVCDLVLMPGLDTH